MPEFHGGGSSAREPGLGVTREGPTAGGPSQLLSCHPGQARLVLFLSLSGSVNTQRVPFLIPRGFRTAWPQVSVAGGRGGYGLQG